MKSALKTVLDTLKVFVLFVFCTILFYYGLEWLDHNYESYHKYDQPENGAVKVFGLEGKKGQSGPLWSERFFQFLRDGE